MAEVLLVSERFVKEATNLDDNLQAKYLRPSIREAQEQYYREIVGDCLLAKLKALVASEDIALPQNIAYRDLLDRSQYLLAYRAAVEILDKVAYKVANMGVVKTADSNIYNASATEIGQQKAYYQNRADVCCRELQAWVLKNRAAYPEVTACQCGKMQAHLDTFASCGIWLGGARGKRIRGGGCC